MSEDDAFYELSVWFAKCAVPPGKDDIRRIDTEALERRTGAILPSDFRQYLLRLSLGSENFDDEMTTWWSAGRIGTISEEYEHPVNHPQIAAAAGQYLFFADYSIWCWAWAVACTQDENRGRVAMIGGSPESDKFVANSFAEFVDLYLQDWALVC